MEELVKHWVQQSRQGDREAFALIVDEFQNKVCAVTFSMTGSLQQSEDIAQESFLIAWNKLDDLREPERIGAWLCGIARKLCKKWLQRNKRDPLRHATSVHENSVEIHGKLASEHQEQAEKRRVEANLAWNAIAEMPEQFREPLVLYYREGRSIREVAETLELTESCVKQRLHRGRQYLKQELERLVESALEATRPNSAFTFAVLASLPIVATTTSGCTTVAMSATGSETLGKAGLAGGSTFVGFFAMSYVFVSAAAIAIFGSFIGFGQMLETIRVCPGIQSRRYVLFDSIRRTAIMLLLLGSIGFLLLLPFPGLGIETRAAGIVLATVIGAYALWRNEIRFIKAWRRIVTNELASLSVDRCTAARSLHLLFAATFVGMSVGIAGLTWYALTRDYGVLRIMIFVIFMAFFMISYLEYFRRGLRLADEKSLAENPQADLTILANTPQKADPLDFFVGYSGIQVNHRRSRTRSDAIAMGIFVLLSSASMINIALALHKHLIVYAVALVSLLGYGIFMKYVAGNPIRRQAGWFALCGSFLVLSTWAYVILLPESFARFPIEKNVTLYLLAGIGYYCFGFYTVVAAFAWFRAKSDTDASPLP